MMPPCPAPPGPKPFHVAAGIALAYEARAAARHATLRKPERIFAVGSARSRDRVENGSPFKSGSWFPDNTAHPLFAPREPSDCSTVLCLTGWFSGAPKPIAPPLVCARPGLLHPIAITYGLLPNLLWSERFTRCLAGAAARHAAADATAGQPPTHSNGQPLEGLHHARRSAVPGAGSSGGMPQTARSLPRRMESRVSEPVEREVPERATSEPRPEDASTSDPMRSAGRERSCISPPGSRRAGADAGPTPAQLAEYGRWLDAAALRQLDAQREEQCWQLQALVQDAWNRKVDLQLCAQLTSDNILARRNGCGQALVFLDGAVSAEENARRVGDYLWVLSQSSAQAGRHGQRQLERCVDLAASYLFKTDWFDGAPCPQLSNLGNLLSKYPTRPAAMEAVAWIAGQVLAPVRLPRLNGKQLALLANAFSKNTDSLRCERAVARIASQGLDHCTEALATQSISLLFNAMSKWPDNAVCQTAAERLAAWLAEEAGTLRAMTAQEVASTLNALSKWPDSDACRQAVERLADRLAKESRLRQALSAQQVANALNAISKWPKAQACRTAALQLAGRVADDERILLTLNAQGSPLRSTPCASGRTPMPAARRSNAWPSGWPGSAACSRR